MDCIRWPGDCCTGCIGEFFPAGNLLVKVDNEKNRTGCCQYKGLLSM